MKPEIKQIEKLIKKINVIAWSGCNVKIIFNTLTNAENFQDAIEKLRGVNPGV